MIRITLLFLYALALGVYARRDWFVALCGALLLMAVVQHPDMPKSIGGVQGLNAWNLLMGSVTLNWLSQRKRRGLVWDLSPRITGLLIAYGAVVVWAFLRMVVGDRSGLENVTTSYLISEDLINCLKWVLLGAIIYDTCRTRKQVVTALFALLGIYVLLAIQVIRWMPLSYAVSGEALSYRASKIIENEIGYNRVNMSMMLSGASWALAATTLLFKQWKIKILILGCAAVVVLGQALTAGRMGYVTWGLLGTMLCVLRWRRALPIIPVAVVLVLLFLPGVQERLLQGFGSVQGALTVESDYEVTSGRTLIWPYVIDKIKEAPLLGYGRRAMTTTGLAQFLENKLRESFPHPHNAYLEMLLDNGVLGLLLVLPFYAVVVWRSLVLFKDPTDDLAAAVGGVTLALVLALLIAAMGSQTFYPREGSVGMWAAVGIMLRVSAEKRKTLEGGLVFADGQGVTDASATDQKGSRKKRGRLAAAARGGFAARRWQPGFRDSEVAPGTTERPPVKWPRIRLRSRPTRIRRTVRIGERDGFK